MSLQTTMNSVIKLVTAHAPICRTYTIEEIWQFESVTVSESLVKIKDSLFFPVTR